MNFKIINSETKELYTTTKTLSEARQYCNNMLLKTSYDRTQTLSDIAAGCIRVYDARYDQRPMIFNCGF